MIQVKNIHLMRGGKPLFHEASLTIHYGQHIGLTGTNGCGKSTLFSLILGTVQTDSGDVYVPEKLRIAHMAQEVEALYQAAIEYVLDGDKTLRTIEKSIAAAELNQDNHALAHLYDQLSTHDGYTARARAEQLLHGLGFSQEKLTQPVSAFSGGWRMRLNLAQTLMCPSDLLLLDEPTNHLDLDAIFWLESWLKQYPGTLIFISHDRTFLDNVADNIAHIEQQTITLYSGNYSTFERTRSERLELQQSSYEKQQKQKAHLQQFIDRFKAKATKARQAQSRIKALSRMEELAPAHIDSPFNFSFTASDKMSDPLLSLRDGVIGYNGQPWLKKITMGFHPNSRIGLLGANGAGKSTLIKALAGEHEILSGHAIQGEHLSIGYFAQHQLESLDLDASPALHIQRLSPKAREQDIRTFLGTFGFHGDKALESVKGFSGGEQARLALALIAWKKPNLLLLDEPTNHLDLDMRYALTVALQSFEGAVVLVSHDRSLIDAVTDELWLIHNNTVTPFNGDLTTYTQWLKEQANETNTKNTTDSNENTRQNTQFNRKEQRRLDAENRKRLQSHQRNVSKLETQLTQKQQQQSEVEAALAAPDIYNDSAKPLLLELLQQQAQLTSEIEQLEEQWMIAFEELEVMQSQ